jgi:hypothetical protein
LIRTCIIVDLLAAKKSLNQSRTNIDALLIEHHKKSRLGRAETFDIVTAGAPRIGRLAPLKHAPRFTLASKQDPLDEHELQAKIAAKQERASRKRRVSLNEFHFFFPKTCVYVSFSKTRNLRRRVDKQCLEPVIVLRVEQVAAACP